MFHPVLFARACKDRTSAYITDTRTSDSKGRSPTSAIELECCAAPPALERCEHTSLQSARANAAACEALGCSSDATKRCSAAAALWKLVHEPAATSALAAANSAGSEASCDIGGSERALASAQRMARTAPAARETDECGRNALCVVSPSPSIASHHRVAPSSALAR